LQGFLPLLFWQKQQKLTCGLHFSIAKTRNDTSLRSDPCLKFSYPRQYEVQSIEIFAPVRRTESGKKEGRWPVRRIQ
jgi:hypothetical protein